MTAFTLSLLRKDAVSRGFEISAMHTQAIEDLVTQNLHVTELIADSALRSTELDYDPVRVLDSFSAALIHSPFLRSMSLLDEYGRITLSTNMANVGRAISTETYLPPVSGSAELLRIGLPWQGRDFSNGRVAGPDDPVKRDALSFIPVAHARVTGGRKLTLLLAFNTDFFIDRIYRQLDVSEGSIDVVRYDGSLLISSDPERLHGSWRTDATRDLKLSEREYGQFEEISPAGKPVLTTFRASQLYPFVIVTRIDRENILTHWRSQAATLLSGVALVLAAVTYLAIVYFRRQTQLSAERAETERLHRINATVFDSIAEAILIADNDSRIVSINPAFTQVTGFSESEILGRHLSEILTPESALAFDDAISARGNADRGNSPASIEGQLVCKDGQLIWTEILSTPERGAGERVVGYHRICRNITERKRMEDQVRQLAFNDPLTRLPNRRLLDDRLSQLLVACRRHGYFGALIFLDLDNFKPLNDTYGHTVGDELLIEVADRMRACVREVDTVARFGGDEFVVLLGALCSNKADSTVQAEVIAEKIRMGLYEPYRLPVRNEQGGDGVIEHHCSASIGVVVFSGHGNTPDDILKCADAAMYQVKAEGRNRVRFHHAA